MAEKIYIRDASGDLEPLTEERFETEELLQELIGLHPELLAGEQMRPENPLLWILIKREMPIDGWAVDHLLLDQDARPTLVEVKRGENREIRRNIVGQMLDYAATAATVWSQQNIREVFEESLDDPDDVVRYLLPDDDSDIDAFWDRVAANLEANRLRLLFVADEIPAELERVVKFLNEQTQDNIEVLAVEIKQYLGESGHALVPRVIGQAKSHVRPKNVSNKCMCGCNRDTGRRFYPGDDGPFKATLDRVDKGNFVIEDIDLRYAAERCRQDPGLYCGSYSSHKIIELAEKQAEHRQQN